MKNLFDVWIGILFICLGCIMVVLARPLSKLNRQFYVELYPILSKIKSYNESKDPPVPYFITDTLNLETWMHRIYGSLILVAGLLMVVFS